MGMGTQKSLHSVPSGDHQTEFSPEREVGLLDSASGAGREQERECGGEGVRVGSEWGGRESCEVWEEGESP